MKRLMKIVSLCIVMSFIASNIIFAVPTKAETIAKAQTLTNSAAKVSVSTEQADILTAPVPSNESKVFAKASTKKIVKTSKKKTTVTPAKKPKKKQKKTPTKAPAATPTTDPSAPKYVALTFDDGPNTVTTPLVLDKLEKYGVVASFFLVGQNITDDVLPVMQRQIALGCEINSHSWTHSYMNKMTATEIIQEEKSTGDKIYEMVGVYPKFFRPPYIATSNTMYDNIDLPFICGIGCNDWDPSVTVQKRADTILETVKDGDIILLHDAYGNSNTVEALDTIIPTLLDKGYKFVTVSELFKVKGVDPNVEYHIWTNVSK